jgi:hypothetical protein
MSVAKIKVNGTFVDITTVRRTIEKLGIALTPQNGSRRFAQRAIKRTWELQTEKISAAIVSTLETAHALTSTFTLIDETNTAYTVLCADDPLEVETAVQSADLSTMYYNVTMTVKEA